MKNSALLVLQICLFACSLTPKPVGKRVYLAKGNISLILPDSSLAYSKPLFFAPDYGPNPDYKETGAHYFSPDSSIRVSVVVRANPTGILVGVPWKLLTNSKNIQQYKEELIAKNHGLAIIETQVTDSSTRRLTLTYRLPQQKEAGWRGQASYNSALTIYGDYRIIELYFSAPDTEANRKAIRAASASVIINPNFLKAVAKPYLQREYRD
ncbi:hypothetical protein HHL22_20030 [Hymenobacter sp. RP-2-7]|uniref:Uncharacterized protein n=1 Tax=Hymenobacter polaris TaxID=2682546 RepID=A0A7Y0FNZ6_9BACT|nr:hypothetical protein [Hymenobacter polaris]NML67497.1 hypothetical protein [Hymenobacter polaris]